MAKITYNLIENFNIESAFQGALCVVVKEGAVSPISNVRLKENTTNQWEKNPNFIGAGICVMKTVCEVKITIDSTTYTFNSSGNPLYSTPKDFRLKLATITTDVMSAGTSATTATMATTTRRAGGSVETEVVDLEEPQEVIVEYLNARDQFAINALKTIMERSNKDIASMSSNEINHYCNVAYEWAASMMTVAANVRSQYVDETQATVDATSLETNTEKILYDISKAVGKEASDERKITAMPNLNIATMPSVNVTQLPNITTQASGSISLGDTGLGRDAQHPIYISGNGMTQAEVDTRIKAWLNATTIVSDGQGGWELNVPNNI